MLPLLALLPLLGSAFAATNATLHTPILILGAGMTGLTAALTLSSLPSLSNPSASYILLDALPRLGGRMHSAPFGSNSSNYTIELGANWVQGLTNPDTNLTNPIWTLAQQVDLVTSYSNYSDLLAFGDEGALDGDDVNDVFDSWSDAFDNFLSIAGERQARRAHDLTARAGLRLSGWQPLTALQRAVEYWSFDMEYSQTPDESSFVQVANNNNFTFNDFSPDNNFVVDPRGFATIATAPFLALPASKRGKVMLNSTVTSISYDTTGVNATLADGTLLVAEYAICTFSVGVLQSGDITFTPPLPGWKESAIAGFAMTTYTKIFLQFESKFWPDTQFQMHVPSYSRSAYVQFQSLDLPSFLPSSRILFTTVTDQDSVRVEAMPDAAVQAEIVAVLEGMYGRGNVSAVEAFYFPRWHQDPLFRGSYSNWPAAYVPPEQDNLRAALGGRLLFAGEATSFKYFGFLQGAYEEGVRAAQAVGRCVGSGWAGCLGEVWWEEVVEGQGVGARFE